MSGRVRIVHNKLLGGYYIVRGPHDTPLGGRFDSREEAQQHLDNPDRRTPMKRNYTMTKSVPDQIQLGVTSKDGEVYNYGGIWPEYTTTENIATFPMLARINTMIEGTKRRVKDIAKREVEQRMALDFAEELVRRYNNHERLLKALDMATATIELGTGDGAKSQPKWPMLDGDRGVDVETVAKICRDVVRRKGGAE